MLTVRGKEKLVGTACRAQIRRGNNSTRDVKHDNDIIMYEHCLVYFLKYPRERSIQFWYLGCLSPFSQWDDNSFENTAFKVLVKMVQNWKGGENRMKNMGFIFFVVSRYYVFHDHILYLLPAS